MGTRSTLVVLLALVAGSCATSTPVVVSVGVVQPSASATALPVPTPRATATVTPTPDPTAAPTQAPLPTPSPTVTPTSTPAPTPTPDCVAEMPVRVALGQLLLVSATPELLPLVIELAENDGVAGVVLLGFPTDSDIDALVSGWAGVPLLLASDEEGGRVQRLRQILGPLPSAAELAATPPAEIRSTFEAYGARMRELGVTMALAPVVDVGGGPGIEDRSISPDPEVVIVSGRAVVEGYLNAGVTPVLKHFPGHGRASADTHLELATTPALDDLLARDLLPFIELAASGAAIMVGHLVVPGLTAELPASLSAEAIDGLLRGELGFDGLVIIDDLGMNAVSAQWNNAEAALLALQAGGDLVILDGPDEAPAVLDALVAAMRAGELDRAEVDESVRRVLSAKALDPCGLVE